MPTYQYACTACDERLEVVQKFTDDSLTTCEVCGGSLRKVYSPVGIVFKGSGFYRTDSRNGSGSHEAKDKPEAKDKQVNGSGDGSSGKAADSGSSSDKSGSGDSKPAKKAEQAGSSGTGSKVA
ncbi:MAG TPA: FmdB family zinc ribbon protein [Streptosporangiaceae bacterium]